MKIHHELIKLISQVQADKRVPLLGGLDHIENIYDKLEKKKRCPHLDHWRYWEVKLIKFSLKNVEKRLLEKKEKGGDVAYQTYLLKVIKDKIKLFDKLYRQKHCSSGAEILYYSIKELLKDLITRS